MNDKKIDEELAKKMINPCYFTVENSEKSFKDIPESHNVDHASSLLTVISKSSDFGIETRYIKKILKEMSTVYPHLIIKSI